MRREPSAGGRAPAGVPRAGQRRVWRAEVDGRQGSLSGGGSLRRPNAPDAGGPGAQGSSPPLGSKPALVACSGSVDPGPRVSSTPGRGWGVPGDSLDGGGETEWALAPVPQAHSAWVSRARSVRAPFPASQRARPQRVMCPAGCCVPEGWWPCSHRAWPSAQGPGASWALFSARGRGSLLLRLSRRSHVPWSSPASRFMPAYPWTDPDRQTLRPHHSRKRQGAASCGRPQPALQVTAWCHVEPLRTAGHQHPTSPGRELSTASMGGHNQPGPPSAPLAGLAPGRSWHQRRPAAARGFLSRPKHKPRESHTSVYVKFKSSARPETQ